MRRSIQLSYEDQDDALGEVPMGIYIMRDSATLDRIEIRYSVDAHFEFGSRNFFVAKASFQMTCGVYSGVLTMANMADLITDRGVHADDIDDLTGTDHSKEVVAAMICQSGVKEANIRRMMIESVMLDDEEIAQSI